MPALRTWWFSAVRHPGLTGRLVRGLLTPAALLYSASTIAYRAIYDMGLRPTVSPALPTVSVGSLAVGGAGKTTVSSFLAHQFLQAGCKPAIILRGYGRRRGGPEPLVVSDGSGRSVPVDVCGDEAAMLTQLCPGAVVAVARRRELAIQAAADAGARVAILDDGFEHFRLRRDLDIILLNLLHFGPAMRPLPAGVLRDPPRLLARAGQVWFTYTAAVSSDTLSAAMAWKERWAPQVPVVATDHHITALRHAAGQPLPEDPSVVLAFCGVGSPDGFLSSLKPLGLRIARLEVFPDHHWYSPADVARLAESVHQLGAQAAVTTWKDLIRMGPENWPSSGPPLLVAHLELKILSGAEHVQEVSRLCK